MDPVTLILTWALWVTMETHAIPSNGPPYVHQDVVHRFQTYERCDEAARWAESQPDLREDFVIQNGKKFRAVMTYQCRKEG